MSLERTCAACGGTARVFHWTRKLGVQSNAHYRCEKCRRVFTVMTTAGKRVALILAVPLALIMTLAVALNPTPREGTMKPLCVVVGLVFAAFAVGAVKQLRNEKANPIR